MEEAMRMKLCTGMASMLGGVALLVSAGRATANTIYYSLSMGNTSSPGISSYDGDGPFGKVEVDLTSSTKATISFTALSGGGYDFLFDDVGVNVNASSYSLTSISAANMYSTSGGFTVGTFVDNGSKNQDGFGSFSDVISTTGGFTHTATTVSFILDNSGGTWSDAASVLTSNTEGYAVAAHVFVTEAPANTSNCAAATGFATGYKVSSVPDGGSTMLMLGASLWAIGLIKRKLS